MRHPLVRRIAAAVCSMALLSAAVADPMPLGKFSARLRLGYKNDVRIIAAVVEDKTIKAIEIQSLNAPDRKIGPISLTDGAIPENRLEDVVDWLRALSATKSDKQLQTLSDLLSYARPPDPNALKQVLADLHLSMEPDDDQNNGLYTASGDERAVVPKSAKQGVIAAALEDIVESDAAKKGPSLLNDMKDSEEEFGTLFEFEYDSLVTALEGPVVSGDPNSKPLLSANDPALIKLKTTHRDTMLTRAAESIVDKTDTYRAMFGRQTQGLLLDDLKTSFEAAGINYNILQPEGSKDSMIVLDVSDLIATGRLQTTRDNKVFLGLDFVRSVLSVLDETKARELTYELQRRDLISNRPPQEQEAEAKRAVETVSEEIGETGDPNSTGGPDTTNDPDGERH